MYFIKHVCSRMHPLSISLTWRMSGFGVSFDSQWVPVWLRSSGICASAGWHELALHTRVIVWRSWRTHHRSPKGTKQFLKLACFLGFLWFFSCKITCENIPPSVLCIPGKDVFRSRLSDLGLTPVPFWPVPVRAQICQASAGIPWEIWEWVLMSHLVRKQGQGYTLTRHLCLACFSEWSLLIGRKTPLF